MYHTAEHARGKKMDMKQMEASDQRMITSHYAEEYERYYNAAVPPIFMNSLHFFDTIDDYYDSDKTDKHLYCYGRVQNPTVRILEDKLAAMERGIASYVFSSGMAAASTAVLSACKAGGHVICIHNAYGPLRDFLQHYCAEHMGIRTTFVEGDVPEEFEAAMEQDTQLIVLESPSSAIYHLQDIRAVTEIAHKQGALVYIDNTYCTPLYQNPLEMGADLVMHTASKYLGGHSDLIGGVIAVRDEQLGTRIRCLREQLGGIIGPMEAWLVLRGIRTLSVRLPEHGNTALAVANYLEQHKKIAKVYYTGLPSHPQYELIQKQQKGSNGLVSFEIDGTLAQAKKLCERLRIFRIGVSWGGYESLVTMPFARQEEETCRKMRGKNHMIRIHCGLEGTENLIADLEQALEEL